jgi:hypothetical protein
LRIILNENIILFFSIFSRDNLFFYKFSTNSHHFSIERFSALEFFSIFNFSKILAKISFLYHHFSRFFINFFLLAENQIFIIFKNFSSEIFSNFL